MEYLKISIETPEQGLGVMSLAGSVDSHTARDLEEAIEDALKDRLYSIVLDLSKVRYMSSAGIGIFISTIAKLKRKRGRLVFVEPIKKVKEVFDVLGLTPLFRFVSNVAEGVLTIKRETRAVRRK